MKIGVIGATGTIGSAVVEALAPRHQVVRASRHSKVKVDIEDPASIQAFYASVRNLDAVVCCAGSAAWAPLASLTDEDFAFSLRSKLMGQVNVIRFGQQHLRNGGSITVTSGVLALQPMPGGAAVSLVNAALEGFVRAAALESPRGIRVNIISPPWVAETLRAMNLDPAGGLPAAIVAQAYVAAIEGSEQGTTLSASTFVETGQEFEE